MVSGALVARAPVMTIEAVAGSKARLWRVFHSTFKIHYPVMENQALPMTKVFF